MELSSLMELGYEESINAIDEIRIYYIESGESRGMLSVFHASCEGKNGKRKEMSGVIRTLGSDYSLLGTEIKSETPKQTRNRLRKTYQKVALTSESAYFSFDGSIDYPYDEEVVEFHQWFTDETDNRRYFKKLIESLIPDYKYSELLTIRRKENNWVHQF